MSRPAGQMNRALTDMSRNQRQVTQSSREMSLGLGNVGTALKGMFVGIGLNAVKDFAEDFNALGVEVRANRALFEQLTGVWGDSERTLARLRGSTMGVVDDMTLMAGAAQLLRLNIVSTEDDLESLVGQIARLKQPTEDMQSAISNFSLMLANESKLRLDSFGISSANVTRRMEELGESFREATMYEMDAAIERLGNAANVADTALARLQTRVENFTQVAAERFAAFVDNLITTGEQIATLNEHGINIGTLMGILGAQALTGYEFAGVTDVVTEEFASIGEQAADSFMAGYTGSLVGTGEMRQFVAWYAEQVAAAFEAGAAPPGITEWVRENMQLPTFTLNSPLGEEFMSAASHTAYYLHQQRELERINELERQRLAIVTDEMRVTAQVAEQLRLQGEERRRTASLTAGDSLYAQMTSLYTEGFGQTNFAGLMLFTPEQALQADALKNEIEAMVEEAKELNALDIISDDELDGVRELASNAGDFADEIQRGADAFASMNLSELLGQQGGGVLGELTDRLAARMGEAGMTQEQIDAFLGQANLASGRETALSQGLDPVLDSLLNLPPESQITAMQNLVDSLQQYQLQGGDPNTITEDQIAQMAGLTNGKVGMFGFDAEQTISEMLDIPAAMQEMIDMENSMGGLSEDGDAFKQAIVDANRVLDDIDGRSVTIQLDVVAPAWLQALLASGGAGGMAGVMDHVTRSNGGVVPGSDPRGRQLVRG